MRSGHPDQGYRKFWPMMKKMTWKERFQHIIYYYLKFIIVGAFLVYMFSSVLYDALKPKPIVLLSGTAVNVHVSVEMQDVLQEGIFEAVGGTDREKETVTLVPTQIGYTDLYAGSGLQTKMLAGDYHYALMDLTGMEMLITMQAFPDLTQVLSAERLAQWEGRLISVQTEGETYPIAIDITGTPLAAGCTYEGDRIFMSFPVNMESMKVVEPFLVYLTEQGLLEIP